jgi:molybdopterin-containing oxidoreductase family membrane subunit
MSSLLLGYAYVMDAFSACYGGDPGDMALLAERVHGSYALVYWGAAIFNVLLPQLLWSSRIRRHVPSLLAISFGVVIGMWLERYLIVVTSLSRPTMISAWGEYHATFWDWATLAGTVGLFLSGILLSVRFIPVVSMHEMRAHIRPAPEHR